MIRELFFSLRSRLPRFPELAVSLLLAGLASASANAAIIAETITPFQETLNPGQPFTVNYKFSATAPTTKAYKVFLHVIDSAGTIRLQDDHYPTNPTTSWSDVNTSPIPDVSYTRSITVPTSFPTGTYSVVVGLYSGATRLELNKGNRVTEYCSGCRSYVVSTLNITSRTIRPATFACGNVYEDPSTWPDRTTELQADLSAIVSGTTSTPGEIYKLPIGGCRYSNNPRLFSKTNVTVTGAGIPDTILSTGNPNKSAFITTYGSMNTVQDFTLKVWPAPTVRQYTADQVGIYAENTSNMAVMRTRVENVAAGGIAFYNVATGNIKKNEVISSLADGIHVTGGLTQDILVESNYAENTGDDSFASIGYGTDIVRRTTFRYNMSEGSKASGIAVEGTDTATLTENYIRNSGVAGIRIASIPSYSTGIVNNVAATANTVELVRTNCSVDHPGILIYSGYANLSNINFSNNSIKNTRAYVGIRVVAVPTNGSNPSITGATINGNAFTVNTINPVCSNNSPTTMQQCVSIEQNVNGYSVNSNLLNGGACPS